MHLNYSNPNILHSNDHFSLWIAMASVTLGIIYWKYTHSYIYIYLNAHMFENKVIYFFKVFYFQTTNFFLMTYLDLANQRNY